MIESDVEVVCLQETFFGDRTSSEFITAATQFECFRTDRDTRGGGVATFIRTSKCSVEQVTSKQTTEFDLLAVKINVKNHKMSIINVYTAPNQKRTNLTAIQTKAAILESIFDFLADQDPAIDTIIIGDFNMADMEWDQQTGQPLHDYIGLAERMLLERVNELQLVQRNFVRNINGRLLDLFFTEEHHKAYTVRAANSIKQEDQHHLGLTLTLTFMTTLANGSTQFRKSLINKEGALADIQDDLTNALVNEPLNINDVDALMNAMTQSIKNNTHEVISSVPKWMSRFPWLARDRAYVIAYLNDRKRRRIKKNQPTTANNSAYRVAHQQMIERYKLLLSERSDRLRQMGTNASREFYAVMKEAKGVQTIPKKLIWKERVYLGEDRYTALAKSFQSNFAINSIPLSEEVIDACLVNATARPEWNSVLDQIDTHEALKLIRSMKVKKDPGPLLMQGDWLKEVPYSWVLLIESVFNVILRDQKIPPSWKTSFLIAIPKPGDKTQASNYRGIAIQSVIPKMFDKLITSRLYFVMQPHISSTQHGFNTDRSSTTNHIETYTFISEVLVQKGQVDVAYFDFSRAFDRLDHVTLIIKLAGLGFSKELLTLISEIITDRKYIVKAENVITDQIITPCSGIPQGSHIGPLLYTIYCNDLAAFINEECPDVQVMQYADDTKLMMSIVNTDSHHQLQKAIHRIDAWSKINHLPLNHGKTQLLSFTRNANVGEFEYTIAGQPVKRCRTVKDLGLTFDKTLSFAPHADDAIKNCSKQIGMSRQFVKKFKNRGLHAMIFKTYLLPKLEFALPIWCSDRAGRRGDIEKLLGRATRLSYAYNQDRPGYEQRLLELNMIKITNRLDTQLIITCMKILRSRYKTSAYGILHANQHVPTSDRLFRANNQIFGVIRSGLPGSHPLAMMMSAVNRHFKLFDFREDSYDVVRDKLKRHFRLELFRIAQPQNLARNRRLRNQ